MASKKTYDVRWEDPDGEQGYYASLSKIEADQVERFLSQAAGMITNPRVEAIEGDRLLNRAELFAEFKGRYSR